MIAEDIGVVALGGKQPDLDRAGHGVVGDRSGLHAGDKAAPGPIDPEPHP